MLEVIPNWHPLFVHFPIALLSMSTFFFVAIKIMSEHPVHAQLHILAYWNLWIGTGFAVVAAVAGWFAYNSVAHDTPSHVAMTDHRNWALATLFVFSVVSFWSVKQYKNLKNASATFTVVMILAASMLASTGWRGSEAVYRYGLGVMSLPKIDGEGHAHEHADGEGHSSTMTDMKTNIVNENHQSSGDSHNSNLSPDKHNTIDEHAGHKH